VHEINGVVSRAKALCSGNRSAYFCHYQANLSNSTGKSGPVPKQMKSGTPLFDFHCESFYFSRLQMKKFSL